MAIVPIELDGIFADPLGRNWPGFLFKHGEFARFGFWRVARLSSRLFPFFIA